MREEEERRGMDPKSIECATSTPSPDAGNYNHNHNQQNNFQKSLKIAPVPVIASTSSVIELLECPVCTNSMYPPIYQCHNGHTLCSTCKTRVQNRCPTCRQELGDIRCLALEKVAESLELPCKFNSLGCPGTFPYYNKLKHESQCIFRPYNCPYAGSECSVVGDIPLLVSHLRDDHKVDMHTGSTFNHRYLGTAPVYMAFLRFMGDETEARGYRYSLEVGGSGRKMMWEGIPRSVRDCHQKVRDSYDGLIIQRKMALFFSGGDRKELKLRITGRIWKEQQQSLIEQIEAPRKVSSLHARDITKNQRKKGRNLPIQTHWRRLFQKQQRHNSHRASFLQYSYFAPDSLAPTGDRGAML
ncbi:hypothetical protein V2J09_020184 [Rumex salicifolius]